MVYEAFRDQLNQFDWRVEASNEEGDGEVYVTIFSGPQAQERAEEYATWKNSTSTTAELKVRHAS